jgi:hypothetical protein
MLLKMTGVEVPTSEGVVYLPRHIPSVLSCMESGSKISQRLCNNPHTIKEEKCVSSGNVICKYIASSLPLVRVFFFMC